MASVGRKAKRGVLAALTDAGTLVTAEGLVVSCFAGVESTGLQRVALEWAFVVRRFLSAVGAPEWALDDLIGLAEGSAVRGNVLVTPFFQAFDYLAADLFV